MDKKTLKNIREITNYIKDNLRELPGGKERVEIGEHLSKIMHLMSNLSQEEKMIVGRGVIQCVCEACTKNPLETLGFLTLMLRDIDHDMAISRERMDKIIDKASAKKIDIK